MSRVAFKQCDVERLLRAAKAVGYPNPSVEKRPNGSLVLLTDPAPAPPPSEPGVDLDAEAEQWRRDHGRG